MKRYIFFIIFCITSSIAGANDFGAFFEKGGDGNSGYEYYEDIREDSPFITPLDPYKIYDDCAGEVINGVCSVTNIPNRPDPSINEEAYGKNLGKGLSLDFVSPKKLASKILSPIKTNNPLTTIAPSYECEETGNIYEQFQECTSECGKPCRVTTFTGSISCQNAEEVAKITPSHFGANPSWTIRFLNKIITTPNITGVCANGFMSNKVSYEWFINKGILNFSSTLATKATLGECLDLTGVSMFAAPLKYYDYLGIALQNHLANEGYVGATPTLNGDMSLSIYAIVAGSCDDNILASNLPHKDILASVENKGLSSDDARLIAESNTLYKSLTDGVSMTKPTCVIQNSPKISTSSRSEYKTYTFEESIASPSSGGGDKETWIANGGTFVTLTRGNPIINAYGDKINSERFVSSKLEVLTYLNSNNALMNGCGGRPSILDDKNNTACKLENRWINSPVAYKFTITTEKTLLEDAFSIISQDTCKSIDFKNCELLSSQYCDLENANCSKEPKKQCNIIPTSIDNYVVCSSGQEITAVGKKQSYTFDKAGHFFIKKNFQCINKKDDDRDYSSFLKQSDLVNSTLKQEADGKVAFDFIDMDGSKSTVITSFNEVERECIQTCKVSRKEDKKVVQSNGESQEVIMPLIYYKTCEMEGKGWKCVPEESETKLSDCSCPNDFVDTIVKLKFIEESANNMKCSTK